MKISSFFKTTRDTGTTSDAQSMLLIQSANPELSTRAIDSLRTAYPDAKLTVLVAKGMRERIKPRDDVEYLDNQGPSVKFIDGLRSRGFRSVFVLFSNEEGYWKLKVLPWLLGAKELFAINENLDWFPIDLKNSNLLAAHMRWRIEGHVRIESVPKRAIKAAMWPMTIGYLAAYEKAHTIKQWANGSNPWN